MTTHSSSHDGVAVYLEHHGWHYEPQNRVLGDYIVGLDHDTQHHTSTGLHPRELDDYKTLNCGIGLQHARRLSVFGSASGQRRRRHERAPGTHGGWQKIRIGKLCGLSDEQNYCHPTNLTKWQGSNPKVEPRAS